MATVNVTSWAEFLSAVAVAGDTVVLPEGATWDMNSICPEGYHNDIPVSCAEIDGNGTTIKNLHLYGKFVVNNALTIDSLYLKNIVSESDHLIDKGNSTRTVTMHGCILTGISGMNNYYVIEGPLSITSSTINWDMTSSGGTVIFVHNMFSAIYSRISIKYPMLAASLVLSANYGGIKYCMVNIDAPGVTAIESYTFSGCVVTGNMRSASDRHGYVTPAYVSVYDVTAFDEDFEPDKPECFKPVTQSQLCDAQYLASIGFPIGPIGA